jgi:hypothetical protein
VARRPVRVKLTEKDFYQLCCGRTVKSGDAEFFLEDLGFDRMVRIVHEITGGQGTPDCEDGCRMKKGHMGACMR